MIEDYYAIEFQKQFKNNRNMKKWRNRALRLVKSKEKIEWERTQELHDLAYEIVERKIKNEFPYEEIISYNFEKDDKEERDKIDNKNPFDMSFLRGYMYLINRILNWRPKKIISEWTNLDKEIVHILQVKEKIILKQLINLVNKETL